MSNVPQLNSHTTTVDGKKIHFLTCGKGEPLILLHGYMTNAATFPGLLEYLGEHYTVFAPDLPGFGTSDELLGKPTLEDIAAHIGKWIIQEDFKNILLAGVSMGGSLSVYLASLVDDRVKGYILLEPYLGRKTLKLPKGIMPMLRILTPFIDSPLTYGLGTKLWSSQKNMEFLAHHIHVLVAGKNHDRPMAQKLAILTSGTYKSTWHTLQLLLDLDLSKQINVSSKKAILLMSSKDEMLNYSKTLEGFKTIFPQLVAVPIDIDEHYPTRPLTVRYLETHYPTLLQNVIKNFDQSWATTIKSFFTHLLE
ncbi:MAG: alpha/beta hydrolase [Candidatus Levybacteria bacterium]|nr:alpha/beta hydrolase [Candidatus Levybacteria bacterium]